MNIPNLATHDGLLYVPLREFSQWFKEIRKAKRSIQAMSFHREDGLYVVELVPVRVRQGEMRL